jgi:hypothetical protein
MKGFMDYLIEDDFQQVPGPREEALHLELTVIDCSLGNPGKVTITDILDRRRERVVAALRAIGRARSEFRRGTSDQATY